MPKPTFVPTLTEQEQHRVALRDEGFFPTTTDDPADAVCLADVLADDVDALTGWDLFCDGFDDVL